MTAKPQLKLKRDVLRVPIDLKGLGPAMRKLPSDRWRAAAVVRFMVAAGPRGRKRRGVSGGGVRQHHTGQHEVNRP